MGSQIASNSAQSIVNNDTLQLISKADFIVRECKGPRCNTSPITKNKIRTHLSLEAQNQAVNVSSILSVDTHSVIGRKIYDGYLNLAASVSSVYNYQCGTSTIGSELCVTNSSSVQQAQNILISLLQTSFTDILIPSILFSIASASFVLFLSFFIAGIVLSQLTKNDPLFISGYPVEISPATTFTNYQISIPATPFN